MNKYKVGDQKVFAVDNRYVNDWYTVDGSKKITQESDHNIWLFCDKADKFIDGDLVAVQCVEVRAGGSDWRRIGDK